MAIMARKPVIYTNEHPYHVTARSNNRDWFDVPMDYCFAIFAITLKACKVMYGIRLHAFVLMNNHFHMIVSTPNENIGEFLKYFMSRTSRGISKKSSRINHIYGARNHKSLITTSEYYAHCMKYVYRNPVKAGMCNLVEEYPWSTIYKNKGKMHELVEPITLGHAGQLPGCSADRLGWYNQGYEIEVDEVIRSGLKRSVFQPKPSQKTKKRIDLKSLLVDI